MASKKVYSIDDIDIGNDTKPLPQPVLNYRKQ